ncbi:hypothetical protein N8654_03535 [Synechococcus sp. AH-601-B19]|nr:hypothetical protein [Synechococcus sp. AH-601-B19]
MAQNHKGFWKSTQNFLLTLGNANARLIINLKDDLEDVQEGIDYQLTTLQETDRKSLKNLRKALVIDSNELRTNNRPEDSLKVIETARKYGIISAQLEAGRAKALSALNQHEQAIQIWHEQASSNRLKIKQQANTEIRIYEQNHRSLIELLQSLRTTLRSEVIEIKHLPEIAPSQRTALEPSILKESIELRNNNNAQLSLKLLEICIQYGMRSDAIADNKARALFKLNHKREAIHIWQSLLSSDNEEKRESAEKILTRLSQSLLTSLKKTIGNNQQTVRHLPEQTPQDLTKLGFLILKEAIALRKEKREELSLQVLELTTSAGFETDAINENRARALINLKRNTEAVQLLHELLTSKRKETQEFAKRILKMLGENLLKQLKQVLHENGWQIHHLPENPPQHLYKLEPALLKEAIELRKGKQEKLSLRILDLGIQSGLKTDRIDDNRARALANNKQYFEAVTLWNTLKESENVQIQQTANSMIERFGDKAFQQRILQEVDNILVDKKDQTQAIDLLTDALLHNPEDHTIYEKLGEVAIMTNSTNNQTDQEFEELAAHSQALAGFEAFITALEKRYKPALKSADEAQTLLP